MKSIFVAFTALPLLFALNARAGDFFEKNGLAINGYDPVSYFEKQLPEIGLSEIWALHRGSKFVFATEKHKTLFLKDPDKYSPQFNGFCAFGLAGGYKAKTEGNAFTVVEGKLYLNYDLGVQQKWRKNQDALIEKGNQNWPKVSSDSKVYQ